MNGRKGRKILQRLFEAIASIALVLAFFFVLIMVFNAIFPEGSGLRFIFSDPTPGGQERERDPVALRVNRGGDDVRLDTADSWAATLDRTRNSVKSKKADGIAWHPARRGMTLHDRDAVQTLEDASALIRFDEKNFIDLGENSLIVIRRMEKDLLFREKRSFMVVVDGELRGRIGGGDDSGVYLEVETPNAVARMKSAAASDAGIEFKIDVGDDDSSAVTIYAGEGEVEAQGETVLLGRNQLTRIEGDNKPTRPVTLPDPVTLLAPRSGNVFFFRSLPPRVRFTWKDQPGATAYRFLLAADEGFSQVVLDRRLERPLFVHGNLREGTYFWKVSAVRGGIDGAFSPARRLRLDQDQIPPVLDVDFPGETVAGSEADIAGRTEPDARIIIAGDPVPVAPDGSFRHRLALARGINVVVVESVDPAGNVTYRSQLINGRY